MSNSSRYWDPASNPKPNSDHPPKSAAHSSIAPPATPAEDSVASDYSGRSTTVTFVTTSTNYAGNLKRRREEDVAPDSEVGTSTDAPEAKRRVRATNDVIFRIVVPSRQIGKVIGRAGHRIQKIREESKATVKIADAISRHEERVIIISSKDSDNNFSDAENALHQIVTMILKDDDGSAEVVKVGPGHVAANTIRLLIADCQAGGLIGVSGQNIENLRNNSGANVAILAPNQLPPCASAHESDRVVQISGDIPAVLRAVVDIGCQLRENPPKQVIGISPSYNGGFHRQSKQYVDPYSAEYVTLELMVSENLVGGLIGRFGANISRIRNESGANIKVYGSRGEQTQRQIHLGGNAQQVALAKQRVDEYVYAELMRQAGGQPHQTAAQLQQAASHQPISDLANSYYQSYGYAHGFYGHSNQGAGMMAAATLPSLYAAAAPTAANQASYYSHQSYPTPPL